MSTIFNSPFQFGKTVSSKLFVNREKEKARISENFRSGVNTILISPRRWGKTSLVRETARLVSLKEKNLLFCFVDVFSLLNEEEFYETLARELIKCTSSKMEDWLNAGKDFFKAVVPRFSYGIDPMQDFSLSIDWKQVGKHKEELINLAETIALKKGVRIVVCIDEFQNIRNFAEPDSFEKLLRSQWQHHKNVSYCLYGSKRHMMSGIFNEKNRPFYRFGEIMMLGKIERQHWVGHIVEAFTNSGKTISKELAGLIADLMKCHSYYVQQLAHIVWSNTDKIGTEEIVANSLEELLQHNEALYQMEIESISTTQINLLKAVSECETQFTAAQVMQDYRLGTPRNVAKNKDVLRNADFIDIQNGKAEFLDPAFELWFRKYFIRK
ncbi:MAG: ATP-binding protein [Opitutaceae bacterium]|nr:ATP-binding protein [Cytophagales bacterium]